MDKAEKVFIKLSEEYTTPIFSKKKTKYVHDTKIGDTVEKTSPYATKLAEAKKKKKDTEKSLSHTTRNAIAGGLSGAIATAATLPLETIQIKESIDTRGKKDIIKSLYEEGKGSATGARGVIKGIGRFYKGIDTKLLKVVPTMAITFPTYQYIAHKLESK